MLAITDHPKMRRGMALLLFGICLLVGSWFLRDEPSASDCAERHRSSEAILNCVAEEGGTRSLSPTTWLIVITGVGALAVGSLFVVRSMDRVMSLHDVAEHLGVPIADVRELVERGSLKPIKETLSGGVFVRVADVEAVGAGA